MTLTLELTPEVEAALRRKAAREGQDMTTYMQAIVEREAQEDTEEEAHTLAEVQRVREPGGIGDA